MPSNASPAMPVKASPAKPVSVNASPVVPSLLKGPNELESLQQAYDEYIEFSKEVESELEQTLKATEVKLADITTKKSQSDAKLTTALAKSAQLSKELQQVQNDLMGAREKVRCTDEMTKKLENTNDALLDKVRILETTEADLTHKLENAEEDIIFLQSDLTEVKERQNDMEKRFREQLVALQAELDASKGSGNTHNGELDSAAVNQSSFSEDSERIAEDAALAIPTEQNELLQELESEVEDLSSRLSDSESQVHGLSEEVGRLTEDAMTMTHNAQSVEAHKSRELELEALVKGLNAQLSEAKRFLLELEESNAQLEETNTALYLANTDLDALNVDFEEENASLKIENVELKTENSLLDDKFLISKQFALELNGEVEEMKRDLQEKNRQLGALQNAMEEIASEQAEKNLQILKLKAEIASNFLELESVKVQLYVQQATGSASAEILHNVNAEPTSQAETEGVIERLKQTIQDLTVRSEFFFEEKSEEECDSTAVKGHSQLITELRISVESLQETLEGFERNLQHAAAQLKIGKDALNHAEFERDQMTSSVQRLGERLLAREVEVMSAHKEGRETESIESVLVTPMKNLSFSPSTTVKLYPGCEGEESGYILEAVDDWEIERAELISRCQTYRQELEESRAQAASQQRQALLADFPVQTPTTKSKSRPASSPSPVPRSDPKDKAAAKSPSGPLPPSPILTGTTSVRIAAEKALASDDLEKLKSELNFQLDRYDSVRITNAKLLQKLQAVKGNIQVCCRTRPPTDQELAVAQFSHAGGAPSSVGKVCVDVSDENEISCFDKRSEMWKSFAFDRVWPFEATQADVFGDVEPLVLSVTEGFNTCLFAYGQTGSGKTFTMNGYGREYGISYRTLQKIFETLELKKALAIAAAERVERAAAKLVRRSSSISLDALSDRDKGDLGGITWRDTDSDKEKESDEECSVFAFSVTVSMMEIYNEQVFDLLNAQAGSCSGGGQSSGLEIRQAPDGTVSVPGLQKIDVHTLEDVMEVFSKGSSNRATTSTNLNEHSSRSHLIMLIEVSTAQGDSPPVKSKLFLVDLAGSERVGKSGVTGQAMKEAQYINKSLSALGDVMEALDQKAKFVPYRNSKLTYLLQDALGGNSRTMMVVTVCPTELTGDETLFTLQFATRVRNVTMGVAKKNAASGKNLEEAVKALKNELKESKKKRLLLEENIGEIKKEQKKTTDKSATVMDVRVRAAEEKKAKIEVLYELLQRSHQDLTARLQEEKDGKLKAQESLKDALKETEKERTDKLRERMDREKARVAAKEGAARQSKIGVGKERTERVRHRAPSSSKDHSSFSMSRKIQDPDSESVTTSPSAPEDSPRSTTLTDGEKERGRLVGSFGSSKPALTRTLSSSSMGGFDSNAGSKAALCAKGSSLVKQSGQVKPQNAKQSLSSSGSLLHSETGRSAISKAKALMSAASSNAAPSSSIHSRNTVRKEKEKDEDWCSEDQYRLKASSSTDETDNTDMTQIGPPVAPTARSNIAARSKEALLRHQLRMEKRRTDKISNQMSQM